VLHRFQAKRALLRCRNFCVVLALSRCSLNAVLGEETTMRWKISHHDHDPRQIDLLALAVLIVVIVAAWGYFSDSSQNTASFIVPSQSVRW
jgi:hypothetical protein